MGYKRIRLISVLAAALTTVACAKGAFEAAQPVELQSLGSGLSKTCSLGVYQTSDRIYRRNSRMVVNALQDVFGATFMTALSPSLSLLPPDTENGFHYERVLNSSTPALAEGYLDLAAAAAARLVAVPAPLTPFFARSTCTVAADNSANGCLRNLVTNLGRRLFGRAPTTAESTLFEGLYTQVPGTYAQKLETVIAALLQSPQFLFQDLSLADRGQVIASELARLIWQSVPDTELMDAAAAGGLATPEGVMIQIRRMLADAKSARTLLNFFGQWLQFNDIPNFDYSPAFLSGLSTTGVRDAMVKEYSDFLHHTVIEQRGTYQDLLLSRQAKVPSASLAAIYRVPASTEWQDLPAERAGILTRAAVLTSGQNAVNAIMRGVHLSREVLCFQVPNPSADAIDMRPEGIDYTTLSTRDYAIRRTSGTSCVACHSMINPPAFALGNFDAIGRFSASDRVFRPDGTLANTFAVDTRVDLPIDMATVATRDARHFSEIVASSSQGPQCFSRQLYRFFAGQRESEASCGVQAAARELRSGRPVMAVLEDLIASEIENLR